MAGLPIEGTGNGKVIVPTILVATADTGVVGSAARRLRPMDASVDIRAAREADFDALTDVWERAARSSHGFMDDDDFTSMRPYIRDSFLPSMTVWLVEVAGSPVAFVGVRDDHVELLYIDPPFHGQGIGTRLVEHTGANSVEVYAGNTTGLDFYRSRGFHETHRRDRDPAGRPYPMVVLRR